MPANAQRLTKAERREAARKEAARLAAKQASVERRNKVIIAAVSVVVVALVAVAGVFIWRASQLTLLSDFEGTRPADSSDTGGITFGEDLVAGTTTDGAPEVQIYVDFICPICGQFDEINREDIRTILADGDATVAIHPVNYLDRFSNGTNYSTRAANAFATVASDAPELALDYMEALFDNQPAEGTEGLPDDELASIAVDVGVPQEVADTIADGTYTEWVAVASDQARNDNVTGTPTIFIDGDRFTEEWREPGVFYTGVTGQDPPAGD